MPTYSSTRQTIEDPLLFLCSSLVFLCIAACSCVLNCMLFGTEAVCIWHPVVLYIGRFYQIVNNNKLKNNIFPLISLQALKFLENCLLRIIQSKGSRIVFVGKILCSFGIQEALHETNLTSSSKPGGTCRFQACANPHRLLVPSVRAPSRRCKVEMGRQWPASFHLP